MAGTPSKSDTRVIKDYKQPRKFLRDMRARIARRPKRDPVARAAAYAPGSRKRS